MMRTSILAIRSSLVLLALMACGTRSRTAAPQFMPSCTHPRYVEVRNSLTGSVDVYARSSSGGIPTFLGSVSPGRERFPWSTGMSYPYAELDGRRVSQGIMYLFGCED